MYFFKCDAKVGFVYFVSSLLCPVNLTPVNPCLLCFACCLVCFLLFCPSPFVCFSVSKIPPPPPPSIVFFFFALSLFIGQSQQIYVICGSCRYTAGWCFGFYSWSVLWEQWVVAVSLQQALLVHTFYFVITLLQFVLVNHAHVDPYHHSRLCCWIGLVLWVSAVLCSSAGFVIICFVSHLTLCSIKLLLVAVQKAFSISHTKPFALLRKANTWLLFLCLP